jgi:hypothetical protein
MCGGALWKVKGESLFRFRMLVNPGFLRVLAISSVLHMIWNAPIDIPFLGKYVLVGLVGWTVVLALVNEGLEEIRAEKSPMESSTEPAGEQ